MLDQVSGCCKRASKMKPCSGVECTRDINLKMQGVVGLAVPV